MALGLQGTACCCLFEGGRVAGIREDEAYSSRSQHILLLNTCPISAVRFVTPDQKYVADNTPHTPTPFKNALEKYGPMRPLVGIE